MQGIRAFVAHSFDPCDKPVVDAILECLDQVSKLRGDFTWDHARGPEPVTIETKVLEHFENKNLLIAICTRKELVVNPQNLSAVNLFPYRIANRSAFAWKTTDWIIQEIGLAVGRGLNVILLLEDEVKEPGLIQGNLERIPISRATPDKCLNNLLAMIAKLAGRAGVDAAPAANVSLPAAASEQSQDVPKPLWHEDPYQFTEFFEYEYAYRYFAGDDALKRETIVDAFRKSPLYVDDQARQAWEALVESVQVQEGKQRSIAELERLAEKYQNNEQVQITLARTYQRFGDFRRSAATLERAATLTLDPKMRMSHLGEAAILLQKGKDEAGALRLLTSMRKLVASHSEAEPSLLRALIALYDAPARLHMRIGAYEQLLSIDPADTDSRFQLGYLYSQTKAHAAAILHYRRIPSQSRTGLAWNNLGVSLGELSLSSASIAAYREAERLNDTLAMSNLGNSLMSAGFLPEATSILEKAASIAEHSPNVEHSLAKAKGIEEDETGREAKHLQRCRPDTEFYAEFGKALMRSEEAALNGEWRTPKGQVRVSVDSGRLTAVGTERRATSGLHLLADPGAATVKVIEVEFSAQIEGAAMAGHVSRRDSGEPAKSLLASASDPEVLMIVDVGADRIRVLERPQEGGAARVYDLERQG